MKSYRKLFTVLFLLALMFVPVIAFAADPAIPDAAEAGTAILTPILVGLATKYTWLVTVLLIMAIMRLVFKPVIAIWESVVKATPGTKDDEFFAKCMASAWYRWLWFALDWLGSIKPIGVSTTNPAVTKSDK